MRALIISVDLGSPDYLAHAQEFEMLATGAGAELVGTLKARRQRPDAAYFIGSGKVQEGVLLAEQGEAEVICSISPYPQPSNAISSASSTCVWLIALP